MSIKTNAVAFQAFQHQLGTSYRLFLETLARNTPGLDVARLDSAKSVLIKNHIKLAGIFLLPVRYPQTTERLDVLYDQYAAVVNSKRTKRKLTELKQEQRETFVEACAQLLLDGQTIRTVALGHITGLDWNIGAECFDGGIKE